MNLKNLGAKCDRRSSEQLEPLCERGTVGHALELVQKKEGPAATGKWKLVLKTGTHLTMRTQHAG